MLGFTLVGLVLVLVLIMVVIFIWPSIDRGLRFIFWAIDWCLGKMPVIGFSLRCFWNAVVGLIYIPLSIVDTLRYLIVAGFKYIVMRPLEFLLNSLVLSITANVFWSRSISIVTLFTVFAMLFWWALLLPLLALAGIAFLINCADLVNGSDAGVSVWYDLIVFGSYVSVTLLMVCKDGFIQRLMSGYTTNPFVVFVCENKVASSGLRGDAGVHGEELDNFSIGLADHEAPNLPPGMALG